MQLEGEPGEADTVLVVSVVPHSSQHLDVALLYAAHLGQRLDRGLPHSAQNFLPVLLSVPH
jgi:hypothetical protein